MKPDKENPMPQVPAFVLYVLGADVLYGLLHVIVNAKFNKINTLTLMSVYVPVVLVSVYTLLYFTKTDDRSFDLPQGNLLWLLMALGLIWAAADYCFIGAYTHGGNVMTITALALLTPVFTTLLNWGASKLFAGIVFTLPNMTLLVGYVLSAVGVWLVVKGSTVP